MTVGSVVKETVLSQPRVWGRVFNNAKRLGLAEPMLCVGSGSSYYLGLVVAALAETLNVRLDARPNQDVLLEPALLQRYRSVIVISRSGTTSEAVWVANQARASGLSVLAVTCQEGSPITQSANDVWVLEEAHDHTVVMIRSFTSMLLALQTGLALRTGTSLAALQGMVGQSATYLTNAIPIIDQVMQSPPRRLYVLGAGARYGIALEATLKALEMSNENAYAYGPMEFRHGPWGSLEPDDLVVVLGQTRYQTHERQVLTDLRTRGVRTLAIIPAAWGDDQATATVGLPDVGDDLWSGPLALLPLQWLAWSWAIKAGRNPDAPKDLAEVVELRYDA